MGTNEKTNEVSTETTEHAPITPSDGMQTDEQDAGAGGPIILFFIFGLVVSLVIGWVVFPKLLYSSKKQPFNFNHALHTGEVDEGCESCHYFREDGSYAGVPTLAQCIDCHEELLGESEDERIFVEDYVAKGREVPWLTYARQPDCVFFSHAAHVIMGNMECVTCHGHIGESETLGAYRQNRISGYSIKIWGENIAGIKRDSWDRMKMDDCSECHQRENVNQRSVQTLKGGCFVCHK